MQVSERQPLIDIALKHGSLFFWKEKDEESYLKAKKAGILGLCKENIKRNRTGRLKISNVKVLPENDTLKASLLSSIRCRTVIAWETREPEMVTIAKNKGYYDLVISSIEKGDSRVFSENDFNLFYLSDNLDISLEHCIRAAKQWKDEELWKKKDNYTFRYAMCHNVIDECLFRGKNQSVV